MGENNCLRHQLVIVSGETVETETGREFRVTTRRMRLWWLFRCHCDHTPEG